MTTAIISTLLGAYFGFVGALGHVLNALLTAENVQRGSMLFLPPPVVFEIAFVVINTIFGGFIGLLCTAFVAIILSEKPEGTCIRRTVFVHSVVLLALPWIMPPLVFGKFVGFWIAAALFNASFVVTMALVSTRDGSIYIPYFWARLFHRRRKKQENTGHCRKCDYNLKGNVSGVCPECGTPVPNAIHSRKDV